MADVRSTGAPPSPSNLPVARGGSARSETVRAAQAAFFQAALTETAAGPRAAPVRPAAAAAPAQAATRVRFDPDAPAPTRLLRPGSLVDIKV